MNVGPTFTCETPGFPVVGNLALYDPSVLEAAGGVVRRIAADGELMVLVVHRRRQDDWSLPKGKLERGERHLDAALREVAEETGLVCEALEPLPELRYRDRKGRAKRVLYWIMDPIEGTFVPNREVDEVRWIRIDEASTLLTYEHDVDMIEAMTHPEVARR